MSSGIAHEPKFVKYFLKMDFSYPQTTTEGIRKHLNSQIIRVTLTNPFNTKDIPKMNAKQTQSIILFMAKQMNELIINNLNFAFFENFLRLHNSQIVETLSTKEVCCDAFCLAICKFLQEIIKNNLLLPLVPLIKDSSLIDLLIDIWEKKQEIEAKQRKEANIYHRIPKKTNLAFFQAVLGYGSIKYLKQFSQEQLKDQFYIDRAMQISSILVDEVELFVAHESVREFIRFTSYLLIFSQQELAPLKFFEFTLQLHQGLGKVDTIHEQKIDQEHQRIFFYSISHYIKIDCDYLDTLLNMVKHLLGLHVKSQMLVTHFKVLILIMGDKTRPILRQKLYEILISNHDKKLKDFIDKIYGQLLESDPDVTKQETQCYALQIAEGGDRTRRMKFVTVYLLNYLNNHKRLGTDTINFIVETYFEEDMKIDRFETFLEKEIHHLKTTTIKKMHEVINLRRKKDHLHLLSIVLEKRLEKALSQNPNKEYTQAHPFLHTCWLEVSGNCQEIYQLYLKYISKTISNRTLQIKPNLINFKSSFIEIKFDYFPQCLEFYQILSATIFKNKVFNITLFRYMIVCQSIFGYKTGVHSHQYFHFFFSRIEGSQVNEIIVLLEYLVRNLKNKSSILTYMQALLEFQKSQENFYRDKLDDLSFIIGLMEESQYFEVSTYSIEALTLLYELTNIIDKEEFTNDAKKIMKHWARQMNRAECNNFCYLFSFREVKNIFPYIVQREEKVNKDRIFRHSDLILQLLDAQYISKEYIETMNNKISIQVKPGEESLREQSRGVKIEMNILRNDKMDFSFEVFIRSHTHGYYFTIKNQRCYIYKEVEMKDKTIFKEQTVKDLKKNPENIPFSVKLEIVSKQKSNLVLTIFGNRIDINHDNNQEGVIQTIQFICDSKAYFHKIAVTNLVNGQTLKKLSHHRETLKNIEVRTKFLPRIKLKQMLERFDFQRMFCIWGQLLKNMRSCSPISGFQMLVKLFFRLLRQLQIRRERRSMPNEIMIFRTIFNLLRKGFSNLKRIKEFDIQFDLKNPLKHSHFMYYLFSSALLPLEFWDAFTPNTKNYITRMLQQFLANSHFVGIENQNFQLFEHICSLAIRREPVTQLINQILNSHQDNSFLTLKFQHYISLAEQNQQIRGSLAIFLEDLINCVSSQNIECVNKKMLCKYLITETSNFDIIFQFCSSKSKSSLIHYIMYNTVNASVITKDESNKITELVQMMKEDQMKDVVSLLIVELQLDSKPKAIRRRLSNNVRKSLTAQKQEKSLHTELFLLVKVWNTLNDQFLGDAIVTLKYFLQFYSNEFMDPQDSIFIEARNTVCCQQYIDFLKNIKTNQNIRQNWREDLDTIFSLSFKLACSQTKKNFLVFMSNYFDVASTCFAMAFYPLQTQIFQNVQFLYNHITILQYAYELLIMMKHRFIFGEEERTKLIENIYNYVLFFIINIEGTNEIPRPLIYVYPKMYAYREGSSLDKSKSRIKKVEGLSTCQLRGGVYFKLILITLQLLETCVSQVNFTKLIETLLLKKRRSSVTRRSIHENLFGLKEQKTSLEQQLQIFNDQHREYYRLNEDLNFKEEKKFDLSPSILDFFLMRLCHFLQNYSSFLPEEILNSYSNIVIVEIQHPKISNELYQTNCHSIYNILQYEDIQQAKQWVSQTPGSLANQGHVSWVSPQKTNHDKLFLEASMSPQHLARSPRKSHRKESNDLHHEARFKNQIIDILSQNPRQWGKYSKAINFDKFFSNKAKELRFNELLHVHYLLSKPKRQQILPKMNHDLRLQAFLKNHNKSVQLLKKQIDQGALESSMRKIKKIYPYTSPARTVIRVMQHCFPNMTCPITQHVTCKDYSVRKLKHMNSIGTIQFEADINSEVSEDYFQGAPHSSELIELQVFEDEYLQSTEDLARDKYCEVVTREGVYFCLWYLNQRELILRPLESRPSYKENITLIYGTPEDNLIKKNLIQQKVQLYQITEIFYRKFSQRYNSIQIFMNNGTSKFITFYKQTLLSNFIKKLSFIIPSLVIVKNPIKDFHEKKYTDKWAEGSLSNFDYLMLLNKHSGRTNNDVNQYYIFPWILKDYNSQKLDLTDPTIFRDLSKPMGALIPEKLKKFQDVYKGNGKTNFYGSHYSTSLFILYYLVRLQPFTTLHRDMQKGFDLADRLFSSISQVWTTLTDVSSTSDIKELIPEFYYLPAFLKNVGNIEFGDKMNGEEVNDVVLPPWSSSAEQFVLTLRAALESDWVSQNLHLWIDLIFGKHQSSQEKSNIFLPISYEDKIPWKQLMKNPQQLKGTIDMITYFGQCPSQLFIKEHRPKLRQEQMKREIRTRTESQSHSTSSNICHEEIQIPQSWTIMNSHLFRGKFHLRFEKVGKKDENGQIQIELYSSCTQLKEILEDPRSFNKKREDCKTKPAEETVKYKKSELMINNEVILNLQMNFTFEQVKVNDLWIVCFGSQGLRTYNWQQNLYWKWEKQEVHSVHLQPTRIIFSTPSGRLCFYSFLDQKLQEVQVIKEASCMQITVSQLPRLPSRSYRNQTQYRILCVGDGKKVILLSHIFEQNMNITSFRNTGYFCHR